MTEEEYYNRRTVPDDIEDEYENRDGCRWIVLAVIITWLIIALCLIIF